MRNYFRRGSTRAILEDLHERQRQQRGDSQAEPSRVTDYVGGVPLSELRTSSPNEMWTWAREEGLNTFYSSYGTSTYGTTQGFRYTVSNTTTSTSTVDKRAIRSGWGSSRRDLLLEMSKAICTVAGDRRLNQIELRAIPTAFPRPYSEVDLLVHRDPEYLGTTITLKAGDIRHSETISDTVYESIMSDYHSTYMTRESGRILDAFLSELELHIRSDLLEHITDTARSAPIRFKDAILPKLGESIDEISPFLSGVFRAAFSGHEDDIDIYSYDLERDRVTINRIAVNDIANPSLKLFDLFTTVLLRRQDTTIGIFHTPSWNSIEDLKRTLGRGVIRIMGETEKLARDAFSYLKRCYREGEAPFFPSWRGTVGGDRHLPYIYSRKSEADRVFLPGLHGDGNFFMGVDGEGFLVHKWSNEDTPSRSILANRFNQVAVFGQGLVGKSQHLKVTLLRMDASAHAVKSSNEIVDLVSSSVTSGVSRDVGALIRSDYLDPRYITSVSPVSYGTPLNMMSKHNPFGREVGSQAGLNVLSRGFGDNTPDSNVERYLTAFLQALLTEVSFHLPRPELRLSLVERESPKKDGVPAGKYRSQVTLNIDIQSTFEFVSSPFICSEKTGATLIGFAGVDNVVVTDRGNRFYPELPASEGKSRSTFFIRPGFNAVEEFSFSLPIYDHFIGKHQQPGNISLGILFSKIKKEDMYNLFKEMNEKLSGVFSSVCHDFYESIASKVMSLHTEDSARESARKAYFGVVTAMEHRLIQGGPYTDFNQAFDAKYKFVEKCLLNMEEIQKELTTQNTYVGKSSMINLCDASPARIGFDPVTERVVNKLVIKDEDGQTKAYSIKTIEVGNVLRIVEMPSVIADGFVILRRKVYAVQIDDIARGRILKSREVTYEQFLGAMGYGANDTSRNSSDSQRGSSSSGGDLHEFGFVDAIGDEELELVDLALQGQGISLLGE